MFLFVRCLRYATFSTPSKQRRSAVARYQPIMPLWAVIAVLGVAFWCNLLLGVVLTVVFMATIQRENNGTFSLKG